VKAGMAPLAQRNQICIVIRAATRFRHEMVLGEVVSTATSDTKRKFHLPHTYCNTQEFYNKSRTQQFQWVRALWNLVAKCSRENDRKRARTEALAERLTKGRTTGVARSGDQTGQARPAKEGRGKRLQCNVKTGDRRSLARAPRPRWPCRAGDQRRNGCCGRCGHSPAKGGTNLERRYRIGTCWPKVEHETCTPHAHKHEGCTPHAQFGWLTRPSSSTADRQRCARRDG
jgi:hypothetical protein